MPLFICEKCGTIENTATGFYWCRKRAKFRDISCDGKALCSKCVPEFYDDGSRTGYTGAWHNVFPEEKYDPARHKDWEFMNKPKGEQ